MAEQIGLRAVIDLKNFNKGLSSYNKGISQMNKETSGFTSSATKSLGSLGGSLLKFGAIAGGAALAGVVALGAGLATFAIGGIKQAISLEQQMADIAAIMGKTVEEVQPLKDLILELAINPNLKVSATEAAQAIELLARNGVSATDIIGGMAEGTVALANATGADFATAADLATDVMALFSDQGVTMTNVIDGITGVTTSSKFSVDDYRLAFANFGPVAAAIGIELEDVNTLIAGTAQNFDSGSVAGAAFRTIFLKLSAPTTEQAALLDKFGISIFTAEGKMRSMSEITQQLNNVLKGQATITTTAGGATNKMTGAADRARKGMTKLTNTLEEQSGDLAILQNELGAVTNMYGIGSPAVEKHKQKILKLTNSIEENQAKLQDSRMAIAAVTNARITASTVTRELTEEEKANFAAVLGGARGSVALAAIAGLTTEEFEKLSKTVNANGQAMKAAATRVDSVQGAFEIFKSIIQGVQIQIGDHFLPIIKELLGQFATMASDQGPKVIAFFEIISGVVGIAINGVRGFISTIQGLIQVFQAGGLFGSRSGSFGSVGLLAALGISPEVIGVIQTIFNTITSLISSFATGGLFGVAEGGGLLLALGLTPEAVQIVSNTISQIIDLISQISLAEIAGALAGIGVVLAGGIFVAIAAGLFSLLAPINLIIAGAALLGAAWFGNWFGIQEITTQAITTITNLFNTAFPIIQAVVLTAGAVISSVFAGIMSVIMGQVVPNLQAAFANITMALGSLGISWGDVWNAVLTAVGIVAAAIGAILLVMVSTITGIIAGASAVILTLSKAFLLVQEGMSRALSGIEQLVIGFVQFWSAVFTGDLTGAVEAWKVQISGLGDFVGGIFQVILVGITTPLAAAVTFIGGFVTSIIGFFTTLSSTLVGNSIIPDMVMAIINVFAGMIEPILSVFSTLSEGIATVLGAIFGGGGGEATAPTMAFDSAEMLAGIESVNLGIAGIDLALSNITLTALPLLTEMFTVTTTLITEQLLLLLAMGIMPIDLALVLMTTVTLPTLQATFITVSAAAIAALNPVLTLINTMIAALTSLIAITEAWGLATEKAGAKAAEGFKKAANAITTKLIPAMKNATSVATSLATALERVARASRRAGATSRSSTGAGFAQGIGFQAGTPANTDGALGLGFKIPSGFPNDSFGPMFAQSGEEMLITPRGMSIEGLLFSRLANLLRGTAVQGGSVTNNIVNNFQMNVQTSSTPQAVTRQFEVMRGFLGT